MKSGIYLITNIKNNRNYVGKSTNVTRRWNTHFKMLNNNEHHNEELQEDWNKFGEEGFTFKIIEMCPEDMLSQRERHWIDMFNALTQGYNHNQKGKKKTGESRGVKRDLEKVMELCKKYYLEGVIGMIEINDACRKLGIRYDPMIRLLTRLNRSYYDRYGIYVQRNWDSANEYISFCKWTGNEEDVSDYDLDYIDVDYVEPEEEEV